MNPIFPKALRAAFRLGQKVFVAIVVPLLCLATPRAVGALLSFDECAYTNADPSVHIFYTWSMRKASFEAHSVQNGQTNGSSGSYELISTPLFTTEVTNGTVDEGLKQLAGNVTYSCGGYGGRLAFGDEPV